MNNQDFILASGSLQRKKLLEQIGYIPKKIIVADIDEKERKRENPTTYVARMAREKAQKVWDENSGECVLGSDTTVVVGGRILHKANNDEEQIAVMKLLSGKSHKVITSVCLIDKQGKLSQRTSITRVVMKRMTNDEIIKYVQSKEWVGAVGYKIEGTLAAFIVKIVGSYSNVVGLPLLETRNLLIGVGVR